MSPVTRISLVVPARNRADYIASAIRSIRRQTRSDFELVVVDDGSTDDTVAVARIAAEGDPRVRTVTTLPRGVCAALNLGVSLTSGKYVGWVDSDDALAPTALERTGEFLDTHPEVGMVYSQHLVINESGDALGLGKRCAVPFSPERLLTDFMTFHFRLMRRALFEQLGGLDDGMRFAEDWDLCLRLSEVAPIAHLPEPLYYYRVHERALSRTHRQQQTAASRRAVERALERRGLAERVTVHVDLAGRFSLVARLPGRSASADADSTNVDWSYLSAEHPPCDLEHGLVSCLCVTKGRHEDLRRALRCFQAQTYRHKELVIVYEELDAEAQGLLQRLPPNVVCLHVPSRPKRPLGALRNASVGAARGEFICCWDDDDWHAPQRLELQLKAVVAARTEACVLGRWLMLDAVTGRAYVSEKRFWEGSLLCRRDNSVLLEGYPALTRGEDRELVQRLAKRSRIASLDCPALYVYRYHGANTWGAEHFDALFGAGVELSCERAHRISDVVEQVVGQAERRASIGRTPLA
jgi:glycosyltransferase involved in cell wall biosynthesis